MPTHADVETITVDGVGHLGMLISRRVVGYIVAALPAHRSLVAAEPIRYGSVANGRRTSRKGVLTDGAEINCELVAVSALHPRIKSQPPAEESTVGSTVRVLTLNRGHRDHRTAADE